MNKKMRSIPMVFDVDLFIQVVNENAIDLGLSLSDISEVSGKSSSYMAKLISDKRTNLEIDSLLAICNVLDADPRQFFVLRG